MNPGGQSEAGDLSNSAYTYAPSVLEETYTRDGPNRCTAVEGTSFTYDARQNPLPLRHVGVNQRRGI
ncbi:hypothetical protein DSM104635_00448 [Terricaulis silvestris]|uniref:Uncharacterized protein n=1 Tax=Terricaulis silvestris TaxID=2686094 RepID=A0A6I6MKG9_9CAUL|nr:hypothetical protein DSM104635_00448 [Terricaulis silvestris]